MLSAAQSTPFYAITPATQPFKKDIKDYCDFIGYQLDLSDAEIEHLWWNVGDIYKSPEAGKNFDPAFTHLPFEAKRSLARCYSFELLLRGDHESYKAFIQAQAQNALSYDDFLTLSDEARSLSADMQAVIRATSFLVGSATLKAIFTKHLNEKSCQLLSTHHLPETMSADGEEFISQVAVLATLTPAMTPITKTFNAEQLALLTKAFWPGLHMRWLYSSEGANNMTDTLVRGIKQNTFNQAMDLSVWVWRWRLNVAGFQGGPAAKFYDSKSHQLIELMLTELNKIFADHNYPFLENYLLSSLRATHLPEDELSQADKLFLGHLITYLAYFHRVDIFTDENSQALLNAYLTYKQSYAKLGDDYQAALRNPTAVTPTYVPGVMDTALGMFKSYLDAKTNGLANDSQPYLPDELNMTTQFTNHPENNADAVRLATLFMCEVSRDVVYHDQLKNRVSCMSLANVKELKPKLTEWIKHHEASLQLTAVNIGFRQ